MASTLSGAVTDLTLALGKFVSFRLVSRKTTYATGLTMGAGFYYTLENKNYRDLALVCCFPVGYAGYHLMKNRNTFSRYIYNLHELVNRMLHKKSNLTYCDVRERYEHFRSRCTDEKPKVYKFSDVKTRKHKEKGCTEPLYGKKARCILKIVPQEEKGQTMQIDKKCIKSR